MQRETTPAQALPRKYPEQVVLVVTRAPDGRANVMAVGWTGIASGDCPLVFGRVVAAHVNADPDLRRLYTVAPGHVMAGVRVVPETIMRPTAKE